MISFANEQELLDWFRDRRMETNTRRLSQQEYAARCISYDQGVQWISRGSGGSYLDTHAIRLYKQAGNANVPGGGPQPLRTTLNEITRNIRQSQASSAPAKLDVHSTPTYGIGRPSDVVEGDICEAIANATIEDSGLLSATRRANFERTIDGMHGFGFFLERSDAPDGPDFRVQCFNFCGYQLTLDPLNVDPNLQAHEYVIHTDVLSVHAAKRRYGDSQINKIDTNSLRSVKDLKPVESKFFSMTAGRLFPEMASNARAKGLLVHTVFLRGRGKRFDRMYVILDTGHGHGANSRTMTVVNWQSNQAQGGGNPYGGVGLPLFCLYGYPRPGDIQGVSDVGMMIDSQDKLNIAASIYMQSLWNHVQRVVFVDRGALEDSKTSATDILRQIRQGVVFSRIKDRYGQMPQITSMPAPPASIGLDIERFKDDVRTAAMRAAIKDGEIKTHVGQGQAARAVEESEVSLDDRIDQDIREYEKCIETLVCTQIRLAQAQVPSAMRLLFEAGLSNEQFGMLMRVDPMRQLPRLKISEESVRRRSRSQRKADIINTINAGVFAGDPTEVRRLFAHLDMPLSDSDTSIRQFAEVAAAKIAQGYPYKPFPMGQGAAFLIEALQRCAAQTEDPQIRERITQMILLQRQIEAEFAQVGQPAAGAEPQPQPEQATFADIMQRALDPNAA